MKESEISILIPTLSRQEILLKTLYFYYKRKVKFVFNICDSTLKHKKLFLDQIDYLSNILKINYFHKINFTDRDAISFLIDKTDTPYAAFSGDDDFFIPSGLIKCADFLKNNKDFRVAYGRSIIVDDKTLNGESKRIRASKYWQNISFNEKNIIDRLDKLSENYLVNIFGVHRSKELIKDYKISSTLPSRAAAEMLQNYLTIIRGKGKFINITYLIRQVHQSRYLMPLNLSSTLVDDNMAESIPIFINALSKALISKGLNKKKAFLLSKNYMKKIICKMEEKSIINSKKNMVLFDFFRKFLKRVFYSVKNKIFRNSKYFKDFIYYIKLIASEGR